MAMDRMAGGAAVTASARFVFAVLRLAVAAEEPLSIAEISRRLGVSVNKAYRAVVTLEGAGYLRRNPVSGRFDIGPVAERLVYASFEQFRIRAVIAPYLRQVATSAEATASFCVRIGWFGVTLALIEGGSNIVSRTPRLGRATLLDRNAAGLAILAELPADEVARFVTFAAARQAQGMSAIALTAERLADIRRAGFVAIAPAGRQLAALGFALRDPAGRPIGSVAIEATAGRAVPLAADPLLPEWLGMVAEAEALVRADERLSANPYGHLDPDRVDFHAP